VLWSREKRHSPESGREGDRIAIRGEVILIETGETVGSTVGVVRQPVVVTINTEVRRRVMQRV
jgi:hypothetical protein